VEPTVIIANSLDVYTITTMERMDRPDRLNVLEAERIYAILEDTTKKLSFLDRCVCRAFVVLIN
jgi:hypothetical protein